MHRIKFTIMLMPVTLLVAALACNLSPQASSENRSATVDALSTSVASTSTAISTAVINELPATQAVLEAPPSPTLAPPPPAALEPTQTPQDLQATQAAAALAATEAALGPIKDQLVSYGVDPLKGQLAWVQPDLSLQVDQYMGQAFDNKYPQVIVQDFVLSSDITWDTEYGAAGCAFVFRSDGNQSKPNQYMVWMTRLASGRVEFSVLSNGQIVGLKDFYANGIDPNFNGANGATNRLTVVGTGNNFTVYTNGEKLGVADPTAPPPPLVLPEPPAKPNTNNPTILAAYQQALDAYHQQVSRLKEEYKTRMVYVRGANKIFPAGIVAMGAVAESGKTSCEFKNTWLWLIAPSS